VELIEVAKGGTGAREGDQKGGNSRLPRMWAYRCPTVLKALSLVYLPIFFVYFTMVGVTLGLWLPVSLFTQLSEDPALHGYYPALDCFLKCVQCG